jgi:hypothetical protein
MITDLVKQINDNKFILAIIMMFLNISSKYIDFGFSKTQEHALRNSIAREILVFCVMFVGTRDIIISAIITFIFFISTEYLLNENSKFCLIPHHFNRMKLVMDQTNGTVSETELNAALETIKKAEKNNQLDRQNNFIHFMKQNKL